jgi:hypothetical protein
MIDVEVELTANHRGHFQLKICPVGRGETEATQAIRESTSTGTKQPSINLQK